MSQQSIQGFQTMMSRAQPDVTVRLLEFMAAEMDNESKNRLLKNLIFRYSQAERKLAELNNALLEKQLLLDNDLQAAAKIQAELLPKRQSLSCNVKIAWKFSPCDRIGGDIFNVVALGADHIAIYMVDVSGHGVPAAMVTVSLSQFIHSERSLLMRNTSDLLRVPSHPQQVLKAIDNEFPWERFEAFFTMFYLVLNIHTGQLIYSNAGHPYPILIRANGVVEYFDKGGTIIGIGSRITFEEEEKLLGSGDKLFFYTDGIVEYMNQIGSFYGEERFLARLQTFHKRPIEEILDETIRDVMDFGDQKKNIDDISLLAIEFIPSSEAFQPNR
jgi:sigma-B regulation protein RsbU (phosphoserine phosphatase)